MRLLAQLGVIAVRENFPLLLVARCPARGMNLWCKIQSMLLMNWSGYYSRFLLRDVTFTILQLGMTKEFLHGPTRMMSRGRDRAVY